MKQALTLLTALVLLTGCITTDKARQICPRVESIGERTALRILKSNNNDTTREALASAEASLRAASSNPAFGFNELADLINSMPIGQLQDEDTRLYVDLTLTTLILSFPDGTEVDLSNYESAQIIAGCLANGINAGLQ